MKKYLSILAVFFLIFLCGCNNGSIDTEKIAEKYVKSQGYKVIENKGEFDRYKLEKELLQYKGIDNYPYVTMWSVQKTKPEKYFGKEIIVYHFVVNNHPLEKIYNVDVNLLIMVSGKKVIGGCSMPNGYRGGVYTLDGKTLEEVTGLSFQQWQENWDKEFGD